MSARAEVAYEKQQRLVAEGLLIADEDLVRRAITAAWPKRRTYRWAALKDVFQCGSGVAYGLCRRFKVDPDELIGGRR